jgi:hypothetical protein
VFFSWLSGCYMPGIFFLPLWILEYLQDPSMDLLSAKSTHTLFLAISSLVALISFHVLKLPGFIS